MPLVVGLVIPDRREAVLANLVADIHERGDHVTAGDVGFHYVVRALTDGGRSDVLYAMLTRTDKPSYGDQLAHGATTLTEAWDANPGSSQNHFMLGHAEEWFYRGLAGIQVNLADWQVGGEARFIIQPAIVGDLTHVSATYHSKAGIVASAWTRDGDKLTMDVTLPALGQIEIPAEFSKEITLDGKPTAPSSTIRVHPSDSLIYVRPAGTYHFESHR